MHLDVCSRSTIVYLLAEVPQTYCSHFLENVAVTEAHRKTRLYTEQ